MLAQGGMREDMLVQCFGADKLALWIKNLIFDVVISL